MPHQRIVNAGRPSTSALPLDRVARAEMFGARLNGGFQLMVRRSIEHRPSMQTYRGGTRLDMRVWASPSGRYDSCMLTCAPFSVGADKWKQYDKRLASS
jgi:hypothetical protein